LTVHIWMPRGILLPAANVTLDMIDPAAMPAPADTRNERRLNILDPSWLMWSGSFLDPARTPEYTV
jgi:hypothetical protein